jgi:hypothetical protein
MGDSTAQGMRRQSGFIPWALKKLKANVDLPTNARVFIESVVEGSKDPITGESFTDRERAVIRDLVVASGKETPYMSSTLPATPGRVNYRTYAKDIPSAAHMFGKRWSGSPLNGMLSSFSPEGRVGTTLGQFGYSLDDKGDVQVRDNYDFNAKVGKHDSTGTEYNKLNATLKGVTGEASLGYIPLRGYGQKHLDSKDGGRPVNITIPRTDFSEADYANIVQHGLRKPPRLKNNRSKNDAS